MNDLTTGSEKSVILKFTIPILIGNVFQQFYNIVDSIIVGRFLGEESLAAVSAGYNIINIILLIAIGFTLGTNLMTAKYFGAKDMINVKKTIDSSYIFIFISAMVVTFIGVIFIEQILMFFKVPDEILMQSKAYLKILFYGTFFSFAYNNLSSVFRGLGNSKTPLYFLILSSIINIVLDILFIVHFNLGVEGAAFATVIAQIVCFIGCFVCFNNMYKDLRFTVHRISFDKSIFKTSLMIGLPAAVQKLLISLGFVVIQVLTNSFGTATIAAFAVSSKLDSFAQIPSANLADALSVFTAQNIGAEKYERIDKGYKSTMIISAFLCIFITLLLLVFSKQLMSLFVNDYQVISIGEKYIKFVSIFYILYSFMIITNGLLLGYGNSVIALIGTIVSFICIQIPLAVMFSHTMGERGIYFAIPFGWSGGLALRIYFYRKLTNKNRRPADPKITGFIKN